MWSFRMSPMSQGGKEIQKQPLRKRGRMERKRKFILSNWMRFQIKIMKIKIKILMRKMNWMMINLTILIRDSKLTKLLSFILLFLVHKKRLWLIMICALLINKLFKHLKIAAENLTLLGIILILLLIIHKTELIRQNGYLNILRHSTQNSSYVH